MTQPFLLSTPSFVPFAHPAHNHSQRQNGFATIEELQKKKDILSHQESNLLDN
jgi:hypothetical protein